VTGTMIGETPLPFNKIKVVLHEAIHVAFLDPLPIMFSLG
jgi:hypothetical protein